MNFVLDLNAKLEIMGRGVERRLGLAVEREAVVRPLTEEAKLSAERVHEAMLRLNLSRSALYKLIRRYRRRPQTSSLLPWKRGRTLQTRLLPPDQEELLQACIREFYLTPERPSVAALVRESRRRFFERQLLAPAYRTVRRRLEMLGPRLVTHKREGSKKARGASLRIVLLPFRQGNQASFAAFLEPVTFAADVDRSGVVQ